jgi:hypothetical protein
MSGPKVVRIVTRDEVIAICQGHLAQAEAALAEWVRIGQRNATVSPSEVAQAEARLQRLRKLLEDERFLDLQKQAPQEVAFLIADQQERLLTAVAVAAQARTTDRRRAEAASALLAALRKNGKPIPAQVEEDLQSAADGRGDASRAMAAGFKLLGSEAEDRSAETLALAQRLKDGSKELSLETWISSQRQSAADPAIVRLEKALAELSLLTKPEVATPLADRLGDLAKEASESRRSLLLDSLEIDLNRVLSEARRRHQLTHSLQLTIAELSQCGATSVADLSARSAAATSVDELAGLLAHAHTLLAKEREDYAARARRAAVLQSLASLGYEVTEGLSTAWVEQGRVVLRKAAQPDYGVEINGDLTASRVQVRAVAFTDGAGGPDPARDEDAERMWCGDVAKLQSQLAQAGGELVIERAHAIGATPLKRVIAAGAGDRNRAREGPAIRSKMLP